uniref:Putative LRR receptor-like serine/threonine-protein kinase n=1 Tax=Aegilops tauschii TaxID=37682 RepID=M8BM19_AEGTA
MSSIVSKEKIRRHHNKLVGRIPPELGEKLMSLTANFLKENSFTGPIPASLANMSYLQFLDLSYNRLVGSIAPGIGNIQNVQVLILSTNNLSGMLPPSFYNLSSLSLWVGLSMMYGSIPTDIGSNFPKMKGLGLGRNHFTGTIPSSISNLSFLVDLYLRENRFSGYVPPSLGRLGAIQYLNLADNELEANDNNGWEFITSMAN